ncbi:MAG: hypothetical protein IJX89_05030 [Alphaproteobacteria bacterium]|nr:hypothetical protein [Alphaproteobacteria bacterium]
MTTHFDQLAQILRLTPYQYETIKSNYDKYDMSGLVKRDGVVYVPRAPGGISERIWWLFFGAPADLIGQNKILLHHQRRIKFVANGYHCVRVGKYMYYADATGHAVSRDTFIRNSVR